MIYKAIDRWNSLCLYHYGVKGMKWGVRHDYIPKGRKRQSKLSINNKSKNVKESKRTKDIRRIFKMSDKDVKRFKKIAIGLGIGIGTVAGLYLVGSYLGNNLNGEITTVNLNRFKRRTLSIDQALHDAYNGDYVGSEAKRHGFGVITPDFLQSSIKNKNHELEVYENVYGNRVSRPDDYYDILVEDVRINQMTEFGDRRLSCWSASNAYYMSAMTSDLYACKSFQNLVNFNDFNKLYKNKPEIFNLNGKRASDFIGKFSSTEEVGNKEANKLIKNIFNSVNSSSSTTPDGSRTIGFINAAYTSFKCSHQWNFEVTKSKNGIRELFMADGWAGDRYKVASYDENRKKVLQDGTGWYKYLAEISNYNKDSIRFYTPDLRNINIRNMSKIILGQKGETKDIDI